MLTRWLDCRDDVTIRGGVAYSIPTHVVYLTQTCSSILHAFLHFPECVQLPQILGVQWKKIIKRSSLQNLLSMSTIFEEESVEFRLSCTDASLPAQHIHEPYDAVHLGHPVLYFITNKIQHG